MRRAGTDPENVRQSDVLCDFCHRQWTDAVPMLEGHHGSCICGECLTAAWRAVMVERADTAPPDFKCPMCLETREDRAALDRGDEPGWRSPKPADATICRRCIKLAAGALHKDPDFAWRKPE